MLQRSTICTWKLPLLHWMVFGGAHVKARGPTGVFYAAGCGRKSFKLDARLSELQEALQRLGLSKQFAYGAGGAGDEVPLVNDEEEAISCFGSC